MFSPTLNSHWRQYRRFGSEWTVAAGHMDQSVQYGLKYLHLQPEQKHFGVTGN